MASALAGPSQPQQQQYGTRNVFYLRLSPRIVLSSTLYLDSRHVPWLNAHPSVFHSALAELRDRLVKKLEREAKVVHTGGARGGRFNNSRRGAGGRAGGGAAAGGGGGGAGRGSGGGGGGWTKRLWGEMSGNEQVDVVRKADFHLAFFFKKMTASHGVLLKDVEKTFTGAASSSSKRKANGKRRRVDDDEHQGVTRLGVDREEEEEGGLEIKPDPEDEEMRMQGALAPSVQDVDGEEEEDHGFSMQPGAVDNDDDDEDTKPKFRLKVRYNGFQIFPKSLTLVLEPSPTARARSPHLFSTQGPAERRQLSATPAMMSAASRRARSSAAEGGSRRAPARDSRMPSVAESSVGAGGAGSSMRDGSAARGTPLFRGSMTPSDVGDLDESRDAGMASMAPPPVPRRRAQRRAGTGEQEEERDGDGEEGEGEGGGGDGSGRDGFDLAEQMLLSQDDVSSFVVNERAADEGD